MVWKLNMAAVLAGLAMLLSTPAHALKLIVKDTHSEKCEGLVLVQMTLQEVAKTIEAFGADLEYDPKVLRYDGVIHGDMLVGWTAADGRESAPGKLRVGGMRGEGQPIAPGGKESNLLTIAFKWACDKPDCNTEIKIVQVFGLDGAETVNGRVRCGGTAPAPNTEQK